MENLPPKMKDVLENFVRDLKNTYGDGLISVILYGSAASGEFTERHSNLNLAIILSDTSLSNLAKISGAINKYRLINPVFFTEDYMKRSTDVFPIEFLDMKENHVILYGKDVLTDLHVEVKNLRFQCEQELKSKLINVKKSYLANINKDALSSLLFKSFISTLHILRNLIRLKGGSPSYTKENLLKEIGHEFQIEIPVMSRILEARNKNLPLDHKNIEDMFAAFVTELEHICDKVDRF